MFEILEKLRKVREFLSDNVPDALDRAADITHEIETAMREAAEFLRGLGKEPILAVEGPSETKKVKKGDKKGEKVAAKITNEEVQELRDLHKTFTKDALRKPEIIKATRKNKKGLDPKLEVAMCQLCAYLTGRLLEKVENK